MNRNPQILGSAAPSGRTALSSLLKTSVKVAGLACVAWTLGGCGQKGPLYLPASAASAASNPSQAPAK
ncbi:MAG: lipoprotein [Aquabacterium sp.]